MIVGCSVSSLSDTLFNAVVETRDNNPREYVFVTFLSSNKSDMLCFLREQVTFEDLSTRQGDRWRALRFADFHHGGTAGMEGTTAGKLQ
jgi:hypothetical protein